MKLQTIRLSGYQCFGDATTEIDLEKLTFILGPNGCGKTALLQALCRLFAFDSTLKRIQKSDFHIPHNEEEAQTERSLWIEADFIFPELLEGIGNYSSIPPYFNHMRLDEKNGTPRVRFRLDATMSEDGEIEETLRYVLDVDLNGNPASTAPVSRAERNNIQVHYLPARRDPADHITFSANALLGRILRAIAWNGQRATIRELTDAISNSLAANASVTSLSKKINDAWKELHKGSYFTDPSISFVTSEIESLMRHLSISFAPGHDERFVDFSRLSDGQKSLLYLSLVLSAQSIGRSVLRGEEGSFDIEKLKPAIFTLVAVEEPENSLSPQYLGRIVTVLTELVSVGDAQALVTTHAPSMLRRVEPECIRHLRLTKARQTKVSTILMPSESDEAHKFVREAIQAFPELYFSRIVVLGEGDSEEIVIPRLLKAKGIAVDEFAICVTPLGGRHVNHFWRLLVALEIPFLTLLDLDLGRHQGGWGRLKYANDQLQKFIPGKALPSDHSIPKWNDEQHKLFDYSHYIDLLEERSVFFSSPMDLDFAMLKHFRAAYDIEEADMVLPDVSKIKAVLGDSYAGIDQYSVEEQKLFITYHKRFKLGSKPAAHISALAKLNDEQLLATMPPSLNRFADAIIERLAGLAE